MHEAYRDAVRMEIEVEREFHVFAREVTLTTDGEQETAIFDRSTLQHLKANDATIPIEFLVSIKVQRQSKWSVMSQNELFLQMIQLGVIDAHQALELMHFDGKEQVLAQAKLLRQKQAAQTAQTQAQQAAGDTQAVSGQAANAQSPEQQGMIRKALNKLVKRR